MARHGDLILRGSPIDGFHLIDALSGTRIAGPLYSFDDVFSVARDRGAEALWRESVDERGRSLGDLFKLPHRIPNARVSLNEAGIDVMVSKPPALTDAVKGRSDVRAKTR